ncbi:hypothetical protein IFR05_008700 [Cadophora sp. M221]|nr:hypothetical protein IFR05_008700 [Cadophora sp. M221]
MNIRTKRQPAAGADTKPPKKSNLKLNSKSTQPAGKPPAKTKFPLATQSMKPLSNKTRTKSSVTQIQPGKAALHNGPMKDYIHSKPPAVGKPTSIHGASYNNKDEGTKKKSSQGAIMQQTPKQDLPKKAHDLTQPLEKQGSNGQNPRISAQGPPHKTPPISKPVTPKEKFSLFGKKKEHVGTVRSPMSKANPSSYRRTVASSAKSKAKDKPAKQSKYEKRLGTMTEILNSRTAGSQKNTTRRSTTPSSLALLPLLNQSNMPFQGSFPDKFQFFHNDAPSLGQMQRLPFKTIHDLRELNKLLKIKGSSFGGLNTIIVGKERNSWCCAMTNFLSQRSSTKS